MAGIKKAALPLGIGLLVGAALGYYSGTFKASSSGSLADSGRSSERSIANEAEVGRLQRENARLQSLLDQRTESASATLAAREGPPEPPDRDSTGEDRESRARRFMERFADMKLGQYQGRLNLSDEQMADLRALFLLQQQGFHESMRAMREGGPDAAQNVERLSQEDMLLAAASILDEEQYETFQEIMQEETNSRNEMMATARLSELSPMLGLSEDQKDAVYSVIYSEASSSADAFDSDSRVASEARIEEALQSILSEEQLQNYKSYQSQGGQRRGGPGFRGMFGG